MQLRKFEIFSMKREGGRKGRREGGSKELKIKQEIWAVEEKEEGWGNILGRGI